MHLIYVVPLGSDDGFDIRRLTEDLACVLHMPVSLQPAEHELASAFDPSRQQYRSEYLLTHLLHVPGTQTNEAIPKRLGITSRDLFVPVLTFVFGQAQLGGTVAVCSTFRLHNALYGLPSDEELLQVRTLKEAMHELGHTFGLRHCYERPCVMNVSTYVEDIDLKPAVYCSDCLERIS